MGDYKWLIEPTNVINYLCASQGESLPCSDFINYSANIATIVALFLYLFWKKDYRLKQAHAYALDLLKKMKILHYTIEQLRAPKSYNPKKLIEDLEKNYIPKIEEKILSKVIEIQSDLIMAKNSLLENENLQQVFHSTVFDKIIKKINSDVYLFFNEKDNHEFDVKKCDLFCTIFPAQVMQYSEDKFKKSILGTNQEVINDDFNRAIEESFQSIYSMLEANLIQKKRNINKLINCIRNKICQKFSTN